MKELHVNRGGITFRLCTALTSCKSMIFSFLLQLNFKFCYCKCEWLAISYSLRTFARFVSVMETFRNGPVSVPRLNTIKTTKKKLTVRSVQGFSSFQGFRLFANQRAKTLKTGLWTSVQHTKLLT